MRRKAFTRARRAERGQALVETLVVGLAMVPLLVGVAVIGKLLDARQAAIAASRAVAFECTVRPRECSNPGDRIDLAGQMQRRLFARDEQAASLAATGNAGAASAATAWGRIGWTDRAGRPMLSRAADAQVSVAPQRLDAPRSHLRSSNARIAQGGLRLLDDVAGPGRFGLQTWDGLQAARVGLRLRVADLDASLPGGSLRLGAKTAILTDAWTASGPEGGADSVRERVEAGWRIDALEPVWDTGYAGARALMLTMHAFGLEPAAGDYRHHWIDMDVVPADRRPQP